MVGQKPSTRTRTQAYYLVSILFLMDGGPEDENEELNLRFSSKFQSFS